MDNNCHIPDFVQAFSNIEHVGGKQRNNRNTEVQQKKHKTV